MNQNELVEIFFSRAFEEMWNEKILDDKLFIVPTNRILEYLQNVISIPYSEYLYFLIDYDLPELTHSYITQCSSFSACEIEMCENLIKENNPGFDFADIGMLFPQYCKSDKEWSLKKYGENQIKTSRQLGLTYEYFGLWYLDCIGYGYCELNQEQRQALLARTILRDPLYGRIVRDLLNGDINLSYYTEGLKDSTIRRRAPGIIKILNIAIREAERNGILLGKCEFIKPQKKVSVLGDTSDSLIKLFDKKVDKSFLTRGMTIPRIAVSLLESTLGICIGIGESVDIVIEFNNLEYQGRINHVNIKANGTECYQIFWKGHPSLADALNLFYNSQSSTSDVFQKINNTVEIFGVFQSRRIVIRPTIEEPK